MKFLALLLVLILTLLPVTSNADVSSLSVDKAFGYLGTVEKSNRNDSPEIDTFLDFVGLAHGSAYCASFVSYSYHLASVDLNIKSPIPKFGAVNQIYWHAEKNPLRYKILKTNRLRMGIEHGERGDILIFKKGLSETKYERFKGHTGLVIRQLDNSTYETIEANTSASNTGDQRGEGNTRSRLHDGVYIKQRGISIGKNFPLIGLVRVK